MSDLRQAEFNGNTKDIQLFAFNIFGCEVPMMAWSWVGVLLQYKLKVGQWTTKIRMRLSDLGENTRDGRDLSQNRILDAAILEFAENGFAGARVEAIAERAEINKRMIYQYFGNKDALYQAVLEKVYCDIWESEAGLSLDQLTPREALIALVNFVWSYYLDHPEFITLLNTENQLKARFFRKSKILREGAANSRPLVEEILRRGAAEGTFRAGVDPTQLSLTITSVCYYYLTNQATSSIVYGQRLMARKALDARIAFNIETILAITAASPTNGP